MIRYPYGSVFKVTRQDTEESIRQAFQQMRECGFNTVVIWPPVFYWEEKGENYPYETGRTILRLAQTYGLGVIMELAGQLSVFEYIPDYEMKDEYLPVDEQGHREWGQDSFGFLNYFHPEVKKKICSRFRNIALAYREFPALIGYDVFNETMYRSFDPYTMEAFREWLKEKYKTIDALNQVWDRTYSDFSQIRYEHHKWMSIMPEADYRAFRKAAVGIFLKDWCEAIRDVDQNHMLIADNIHSQVTLQGCYTRPQDDYDLKRHVDEIGMSFYPKGVDGVFPPAQRHQIFSGFADAARGDGFLISEMQTHIQAMFNPATAVRPWELKQWCLEAYAYGAKGLIYWMWRPFDKGLQTLGRGLVDYRGCRTERFEIAQALGDIFLALGPAKPLPGQVGVVYDPLSEDFQYLYTEAYNVDQQIYLRSVYGGYKALFDLGISCDMIRTEELEGHQAVIMSSHIALTHRQALCLRTYIENGGICIVDGRFGLVDEASVLFRELPGGPVFDLCGQTLLDSDYEDLDFPWDTGLVRGSFGRDLVALTDGTVRSTFRDGFPAVVEKRTGKGKVIYVNTHLCYGYAQTDDQSVREFLGSVLEQEGIRPQCGNPAVKVKGVIAQEKLHAVVFNYSPTDQDARISLNGETIDVHIPARDAVIIPMEA